LEEDVSSEPQPVASAAVPSIAIAVSHANIFLSFINSNSFSTLAEHAFICPALISIPALLSKSTAVDDIIILDFSQLCNTIYAKRSFSS
jgi:hypothetical protein